MRKRSNQQQKYYFSDKLKRQLAGISHHPLTIVEAPSGFGKTTAVREYLKENLPHGACEYWYTCLGEPVSIAWMGICELFSNVNRRVADDLKNLKIPTVDTLFYVTSYLRDVHCKTETYLVVDNYQLVNSNISRELISAFSMHGNPKLHMIFITQQLESAQQISTHNNNVHTIDAASFFFDKQGAASLFRMEGIRLSDDELEKIHISTEGWVSALCLQIINFKKTGSFSLSASIEQLVENAIWNRLTPDEKDFLLSVSIMDSFTAHQAAIILNQEALPEKIEELLKTNDFIRYLPDNHMYSMHSILQDYLRNRFYHYQTEDYQNRIFRKAGQAYATISQYFPAAKFYLKVRDFDAILSLPFSREYFCTQKVLYQSEICTVIVNECPEETLCKYPLTMLVFGYQMLVCGKLEVYQKLSRLLHSAIQNGMSFDCEELRRINGEYMLLKCLGEFNDISKMKKRQNAAWKILRKPSEIIKSGIPWVLTTTSVLNMFWRESGELENEMRQMDEGAPLSRKLIGGQGVGCNSVMRAEAMLMRGKDVEAEIFCHKALYEARSFQQVSICLCAELVLARIAILRGDVDGYFTAIKNIQGYAKENSSIYILRIIDECMSIISLVLGVKDYVVPWLYDMESIKNVMYAPVIPHVQMLYLKFLLIEKRYNEFYGISQLILDMAKNAIGNVRYMMPQVYHLKYLAIVKLKNGNYKEAQEYLKQALAIALPDKIYLPFAQQMNVLYSLLESAKNSVSDREGLNALIALGRRQEKGTAIMRKAILSDRSPLTPREREVALYARDRLSAKEIANKLYISETTVRTILRSIYSKLDIHSKTELTSKKF